MKDNHFYFKKKVWYMIIPIILFFGSLFFYIFPSIEVSWRLRHMPQFLYKQEIQGTSTPVDANWTLYENIPIGFRLEYPRYPKLTDEIHPRAEVANTKHGKSYTISFSSSLSEKNNMFIDITPSEFNTLNEWDPDFKRRYGEIGYVVDDISIDGTSAAVMYHPCDPRINCSENRQAIFFRDDRMYQILISGTSAPDADHILNSFRFIENK